MTILYFFRWRIASVNRGNMADGITMRLDTTELTEYMTIIEKRMGNLRRLFEVIIPILHNSIIANFRKGGRPKRWEPLSAWTLNARKWRAKQKTGHGFGGTGGLKQPILMDTHKLYLSIGSVNRIASKFCEYGTRDFRAPTLQGRGFGRAFGTTKHVPTKFVEPRKPGGVLHWVGKGGKHYFSKGHWLPPKTVTIPGRPFILFQKKDVDDIVAYGATFSFSEKLPRPPSRLG